MSRLLDGISDSVGAGLPRIAAALVLLIAGLLLARLLGGLLGRGLEAAGLDGLGERLGVHDPLERLGMRRSASHLVGRFVRIGLSVVFVLAAVSLIGLAALDEALNRAVLFLPQVLTAFALVLAGIVVGAFLRGRVDRIAAQMDLPGFTGRAVELLVIVVFAVTALAQIGVSTQLLSLLVAILLGGLVLTFAVAFGLGGREAARAVSAGRLAREAYAVGDEVAVAGHRGEVVTFEAAATVLRTSAGSTVRIPHHLMVDSVVETFD